MLFLQKEQFIYTLRPEANKIVPLRGLLIDGRTAGRKTSEY